MQNILFQWTFKAALKVITLFLFYQYTNYNKGDCEIAHMVECSAVCELSNTINFTAFCFTDLLQKDNPQYPVEIYS